MKSNPHKNQTKSKFFGKARKLNFTPLLHIASPWQEYKQPVLFFSSKQFCLSEKNNIFDLPSRLVLASPNWAENRPFSFDSHVATIEHRKIVMQPTCCITFPCPKPTISRTLDQSNCFAVNKTGVFINLNYVGRWEELLF